MSIASPSIAGANPAETYERHFVPAMFLPWAGELLQRATPHPGERVLDVACGTGAVARQVAPLVGPTGKVVGVDPSPGMLAVARAQPAPAGAAITWLEGSADALPGPDGGFDLVLCQHGLQFFPDRAAAAAEMRRVLTSVGRVGISVWRSLHEQPVFYAFDAAVERHLGVTPDNTPFSFGDAAALRSLLELAGFRDVAIEVVTRPVRFPSPDHFARLTTIAAAAVLPDFAELDEITRESLIAAVHREIQGTLEAHRRGTELVFPLSANIAVARA